MSNVPLRVFKKLCFDGVCFEMKITEIMPGSCVQIHESTVRIGIFLPTTWNKNLTLASISSKEATCRLVVQRELSGAVTTETNTHQTQQDGYTRHDRALMVLQHRLSCLGLKKRAEVITACAACKQPSSSSLGSLGTKGSDQDCFLLQSNQFRSNRCLIQQFFLKEKLIRDFNKN